eukprot:4611841-Amphidinium_carterae.1
MPRSLQRQASMLKHQHVRVIGATAMHLSVCNPKQPKSHRPVHDCGEPAMVQAGRGPAQSMQVPSASWIAQTEAAPTE